jgi:hypothetical protein
LPTVASTQEANASETKTVASSSEEALASLKKQAQGKKVGDTVSAAYMENGQVKVYTASVKHFGISPVLSRNATVQEKAMLQGNRESPSNVFNETGTKGIQSNNGGRLSKRLDVNETKGEGKTNTSSQFSNKLAKGIYQRAETSEPKVTETLKTLEMDGAHLEGLKFKLKSTESLTRKILTDSQLKGISLGESASGISDSLRYTLVINEANYAETVESSLIKLQNQGYTINKVKNYWGNKTYQGINAILTTPEGLKMELQFHTNASYYTKEVLNHSYYEIERSLTASLDEAKEANKIMVENQSHVRVPKGAQNIWKLKGDK